MGDRHPLVFIPIVMAGLAFVLAIGWAIWLHSTLQHLFIVVIDSHALILFSLWITGRPKATPSSNTPTESNRSSTSTIAEFVTNRTRASQELELPLYSKHDPSLSKVSLEGNQTRNQSSDRIPPDYLQCGGFPMPRETGRV